MRRWPQGTRCQEPSCSQVKCTVLVLAGFGSCQRCPEESRSRLPAKTTSSQRAALPLPHQLNSRQRPGGGGGRGPGGGREGTHLLENAIHQSRSSWYHADGVGTTRGVTRMKGGTAPPAHSQGPLGGSGQEGSQVTASNFQKWCLRKYTRP